MIKIQNCSCADACSFGGTKFGGWVSIDSASKRKCYQHSCNFGFFRNVVITIEVLNHFRKMFREVMIPGVLEVCSNQPYFIVSSV